MIKVRTLKNGITAMVVPMKGVKAMTALVLVRTGSKYETRRTNGVAHFVEHMIFKGSKKYPSVRTLTETLDRLGSEYNAFTSKEMTGYWIKAAGEKRDKVVDIVSSMLRDPLFPKSEMERERGVILQELNLYFDTPVRFIGDLWEKVLWGDQPAGWYVGGTPKSVLGITHKDLEAFFQRDYVGHATVVCLAGAVGTNDLSLLSRHFSGVSRGQRHQHPILREQQSRPELLVHYKKTDQTHIAFGFRGVSLAYPKRYAMAVLANILGGSMSSRLFLKLRDRLGLAYSVRTESFFDTEGGYLVTTAGVEHKKLMQALVAVLKEYRAARLTPPSSAEVTKAKESLLGKFVLDLEQTDEVASYVGMNALLLGTHDEPEVEMKKIRHVTPKDVQNAAKFLFRPERLNLALIGPWLDKKPLQKLLESFR